MKLRNLTINLNPAYDENPGKYSARIEYENIAGEVKLRLDEKVTDALLLCIGDVIVRFATASANELKNSIVASVEEARKVPEITV